MPESGLFQVPLSGTVRLGFSAGRVEIVTFGLWPKEQKLGFLTEAIYLKACFAESEIQHLKKRSFLAFW